MKTSNNINYWLSESLLTRTLLLGLLILLLQIPVSKIQDLVTERQFTEQQAIKEVQKKWGESQQLIGPLLVIPYLERYTIQDSVTLKHQEKTRKKSAVFLPNELISANTLTNESRYRGIFEVPLYKADISLSGNFSKPSFTLWDVQDADILWGDAKLVLMVSDARAIQKQAAITWNSQNYYFDPGTDEATSDNAGYHVDLTNMSGTEDSYSFNVELRLNGSQSLYIAPLGKDSEIKIGAGWPDPSFQGKWLPTVREVNSEGFSSQWDIPYLGRNFPLQTNTFAYSLPKITESLVGVDLISPVDNYRMTERSIKYETLFLVLTFLVIWLFEILSKLRVHIMQYLFIGAALCLFYLLELSLSEHLGFYIAYAIATSAIVGMVSFYSYIVLKTGKRAAVVGSGLAGLYFYLFSLLKEQNYSLLIGSIGLFLILGGVMYITRHVEWDKVAQFNTPKPQTVE